MSGRGKRRVLATVLFTDIVGSSELAVALGDTRWRALLAGHHTIVRKNLRRFGGREMDTAGDGFFAVFDTQADAIRCACAIGDAVRDLGVEVRAGLHVGEGEPMGGKLGGIAVHTAARVMAVAGPGEVLVSGTLHDLVAGSGLEFEDRGEQQLKGIPGEWRLYAVTALDGAPRRPPLEPQAARERLDAIRPTPLLRRPSRAAVAGLVTLAVLAGAFVAIRGRGRTHPAHRAAVRVTVNSLVKIDPRTNEVVADVPVGINPYWLAVSGGKVYVVNHDGTVSVVDPATNRALSPVGGIDSPCGVTSDPRGGVWIASCRTGDIVYMDPQLNIKKAPVPVPDLGAGDVEPHLAYGFGSVWVAVVAPRSYVETDHVVRIDPTTGKALATIEVGSGAFGIAVGDGAVWVTNYGDGTVSRIDPKSDRVETTIEDVGTGPVGIAVGGGSVWTSDAQLHKLWQIDPVTNRVVDAVPDVRGAVAASDEGVWLLDMNTVMRIDPQQPHVVWSTTLPITGQGAVAIGAGAIWVTAPAE